MTANANQHDGMSTLSEYPDILPPPNTQRSNRRIAAVLVSLLLTIALAITLVIVFPLATSPPTQQTTSSNWSGYCAVSNLDNPQPEVTSVSASWTVPAVSVSIRNSYSAAWIGVGGQYDETLIQVGTEQDSVNGRATYSVWYELLPRYAVTIDTLSISSGDKVTASISLSSLATNTWLIELADLTNRQSFKKSLNYVSSMLSADWIVEAPTLNNRISTMANFGEVTFTDCKATIGGQTGTISSFPSSHITLNGHRNITLLTVSTLASGDSSFTVSYES